MKLKFLLLALIFSGLAFGLVASPAQAILESARTNTQTAIADTPLANPKITSLPVLVGTIVQVVLGTVGVLFIILIIWAGITWMTAAGDSKKIEKARSIIITAAAGLIIVMVAYAITIFILEGVGVIQPQTTGSQLDTASQESDNVHPALPDNPSTNP